MIRGVLIGLAVALFAAPAAPAVAQSSATIPVSPELRQAAETVINVFMGTADLGTEFTRAFLEQVPDAQINEITASLSRQYGAVREVASLEARSASTGSVRYRFDRAILRWISRSSPSRRIASRDCSSRASNRSAATVPPR